MTYKNQYGAEFKEDPKGGYKKNGKKYSYVGNSDLKSFTSKNSNQAENKKLPKGESNPLVKALEKKKESRVDKFLKKDRPSNHLYK